MGDRPDYDPVRFDWQRAARTGVPETVLCDGKSVEHIATILSRAAERDSALLLTRLSEDQHRQLAASHPLDYCALSRTAFFGQPVAASPDDHGVALVCAGTSDLPVIEEARRTLLFHGRRAPVFADVGVAGLWRLIEAAEDLSRYRVLIAVAGMEGALFSALAGLVPGLVIAVPAPVGYGVSQGGRTALDAALASCAPGVVTVNIGNGFGAAIAALKLLGPK